MVPSRFEDVAAIAEERDGLVTTEEARSAGISDSTLSRLVQRGRLERAARGVYRVRYATPGRFSQLQEAVLWAKGNRGPQQVALSHGSALVVYGISDANPGEVHLTVPTRARLRRLKPEWIELHRGDLVPEDLNVREGLPVTTVRRTVADLLVAGGRIDIIRQAIRDARREGFIDTAEAKRLGRRVEAHLRNVGKAAQTAPQ